MSASPLRRFYPVFLLLSLLLAPLRAHAEPFGVEIRLYSLDLDRDDAPLERTFDIDVPVKVGSVEGSRVLLKAGDMRIKGGDLTIANLSVALAATRFSLEKKRFLKLECRDVSLEFSLAELKVALPKEWRVNKEGVTVELRPALEAALKPLFTEDALKRSLRLRGDCKGAEDVLTDIVRARFTDLPSKDAERFDKIVTILEESAQRQVHRAWKRVRKAMPDLAESTISYEGRAWVIRPAVTGTQAVDIGLSAKARAQLESFVPTGPGIESRLQLVFKAEALGNLVSYVLRRLEARGDERMKDGHLQLDYFDGKLKAGDVKLFLPEIDASNPERLLGARFLLPYKPTDDETKSQLGAPTLRPWIHRSGTRIGLTLQWGAVVHVQENATAPLETRRGARIEADLSNGLMNAKWVFGGGQWLREPPVPEGAPIPELPAELGHSLDYALKGDELKGFLEAKLANALDWSHLGEEVRFRMVGQVSPDLERPQKDGYWAEALVVDIKNLKKTEPSR